MGTGDGNKAEPDSSSGAISPLEKLTRHPFFGLASLVAGLASLFSELPLWVRLGIFIAACLLLTWTVLPGALQQWIRSATAGVVSVFLIVAALLFSLMIPVALYTFLLTGLNKFFLSGLLDKILRDGVLSSFRGGDYSFVEELAALLVGLGALGSIVLFWVIIAKAFDARDAFWRRRRE
jgi:hypothetical protein